MQESRNVLWNDHGVVRNGSSLPIGDCPPPVNEAQASTITRPADVTVLTGEFDSPECCFQGQRHLQPARSASINSVLLVVDDEVASS
jgi:hypothetical protein